MTKQRSLIDKQEKHKNKEAKTLKREIQVTKLAKKLTQAKHGNKTLWKIF